ncbi:MAG: iron ABC transporter [Cyclobacteriaceae bacterium]|nr:MAG: iron ABC transporter [Cyclobacteriaceae bacterium]
MNYATFTDQMGYEVTFRFPPQRIVSLVPSQTELLSELCLDSRVVGITRFCVRPPEWKKHKTLVGGTKNFRPEIIRSLNPDLVIGNREENHREGIEALKKEFPVWMSDVINLESALDMIRALGNLTGCGNHAQALAAEIESGLAAMETLPRLRALYLIWKNPWMGAGSRTFIHQMMCLAGFTNVLENTPRYPPLTDDDIRRLAPEVVLLSSEPYPFREKHIAEIRQLLPEARIILTDGEMFSWYGSRMLYFPDYIRQLKSRLT